MALVVVVGLITVHIAENYLFFGYGMKLLKVLLYLTKLRCYLYRTTACVVLYSSITHRKKNDFLR